MSFIALDSYDPAELGDGFHVEGGGIPPFDAERLVELVDDDYEPTTADLSLTEDYVPYDWEAEVDEALRVPPFVAAYEAQECYQ